MDKVAAGQLRLVSTDIRYGEDWVKAGTPYLVLRQLEELTLDGKPYENNDTPSWVCQMGGNTYNWYEDDVAADRLVVQE